MLPARIIGKAAATTAKKATKPSQTLRPVFSAQKRHQKQQKQQAEKHVIQQQSESADPFQLSRLRAEEHERRMAVDPESRAEWAEFAKQERLLDQHVFGQLEKERGVDELMMAEAAGEEQPLEEMWAQREFEHLMLSPDRIRQPEHEPSLAGMETGEETASRPPNQYRKIVYTDELKNSDLSKPASPENPHPFDPDACTMPPTHSRSLAQYANFVPTLQLLVEMGVDLFEAHQEDPRLGRALIRLKCEEDVKPKIYWLCKQVGVPAEQLGSYLTRNPYFLLQELDQLKTRHNYLKYRRFTQEQCAKIVVENRYWLNLSVDLVDSRLGWVQRQFRLRPAEMRLVLVKEPKVIAFGTGPIGGFVRSLSNSCGFTQQQLKLILVRDPRLFLLDLKDVLISYNYLAYVMRVANEQLVEFPCAMRCRNTGLRRRHEFLWHLRKANYTPGTPGYITLDRLLHPSDRFFAEQVAQSTVAEYNRFLRRN